MFNLTRGGFLLLFAALFLLIACEDEKIIDTNGPKDWTETVNYKEPFKNKIFKKLKTGELIPMNEQDFIAYCKTMGEFSDIQTMSDFELARDVVEQDGKKYLALRGKLVRGEQATDKQAQESISFGVHLEYDSDMDGFVSGRCICVCLYLMPRCGSCTRNPGDLSCSCHSSCGGCIAYQDCAQP